MSNIGFTTEDFPEIKIEISGTGNGNHHYSESDNEALPPVPDSPSFKAKRKTAGKGKETASDPQSGPRTGQEANRTEQMMSLFQRFRVAVSPRSSKESLRSPNSSSGTVSSGTSSDPPSAKGSSLHVNDAGTSFLQPRKPSVSRSPSLLDIVRRKSHFTLTLTYNLDELISKLIDSKGLYLESCRLSFDEMTYICTEARELFLSQPMLLELRGPIHVCGDIHGQFSDLVELFKVCGDPAESNYLFLGDYVDRGNQSLETILLLLCYKLKYPTTFFMLRGNHECASINKAYGFFDECKRRANVKIWKNFANVFEVLPIAAVISERVFCVHGGISPTLHDLEDIRSMQRPLDICGYGTEADLLWSDPSEEVTFWEQNNERGVSFVFGPQQVDDFLRKFGFDLIIRAHMVVEDGYEFFNGRTLVTIFSAPNYCGEFDNKGGIVYVDETLKVKFKFLLANANIRRTSSYVPSKSLFRK